MPGPTFASLCNLYAGQTGWVVGRGPTRFRYEALKEGSGPVFFVNDAVSQEKWLDGGRPSFFFAHDSSMRCWLHDKGRRSVPVVVTDQPETGPSNFRQRGLVSGPDDPVLGSLEKLVTYTKAGPFGPVEILSRSREDIRAAAQLFTSNATIQPLLHFAWYVGCSSLNLVGCDGFSGIGYDMRLENRSLSVQRNATEIRVKQDEVLRRLGLPATYLGEISHRIETIAEVHVARDLRAGFLLWSESLMRLWRNNGAVGISLTDSVFESGTSWISGTWPGIKECSACLSSEDYKVLVLGAHQFVSGEFDKGFKVAHRAVPLTEV
jgi:hypothetical protein